MPFSAAAEEPPRWRPGPWTLKASKKREAVGRLQYPSPGLLESAPTDGVGPAQVHDKRGRGGAKCCLIGTSPRRGLQHAISNSQLNHAHESAAVPTIADQADGDAR